MNEKVFISGSISIKSLPESVRARIDNIIKKRINILVGDASGVDSIVQNFCLKRDYFNVTVYHINVNPRYLASEKFKTKYIKVPKDIKKERERQYKKDEAMTIDADYSFVIWDGKSKGSFQNIKRALNKNKLLVVYLLPENKFLKKSELSVEYIENIFRQFNGYTATEVISILKKKNKSNIFFNTTKDLYNYLLNKGLVNKIDNKFYIPNKQKNYQELFIEKKYKGKVVGINFSNKFIYWLEKELENRQNLKQTTLF